MHVVRWFANTGLQWLRQRFELPRHANAPAFSQPMEGMRGFAVLLVFLVHYIALAEPMLAGDATMQAITGALKKTGESGVDLFFLLSGFLIYGSLIKRAQDPWIYTKRRLGRIYPAFTVVFVLYIGLSWALPEQSRIPAGSWNAFVYLLQNYMLLPGVFPITPLITVAWSLSYEMLFYLVIPLLIALLRLRGKSTGFRLGLFVTVLVLGLLYCALFGGRDRMFMFVAGIVMFEVMGIRNIASIRWPALVAPAALLIALLATLVFPSDSGVEGTTKVALLCAGYGLMCLVCFLDPRTWLARVFTLAPLRWFGNMSYSYYLMHGLALKAGFMALWILVPAPSMLGTVGYWALLLPMLAFTMVPSAILFLLVERPLSLDKGSPAGKSHGPATAVAVTDG